VKVLLDQDTHLPLSGFFSHALSAAYELAPNYWRNMHHPLTQQSVAELNAFTSAPCLSLYQPTHRNHPDNQQDVLRFRQGIASLESSLLKQYSAEQTQTLVAPFRALATEADFWNHTLDGLAIVLVFIGTKMLIIDLYKIPVAWSLGFTVITLAVTMLLSLRIPPKPGHAGTAFPFKAKKRSEAGR
jgi:hypothetical protein